MYDVALTVRACLDAGTAVTVAWPVAGPDGAVDPTEALALTPGGGEVGGAMGGALNAQLADHASVRTDPRLVTVSLGPLEQVLTGAPIQGDVRYMLVPADRMPARLWSRLVEREPVLLVADLEDEGTIGDVRCVDPEESADDPVVQDLVRGGAAASVVTDHSVLTLLRPTPSLVLAGRGPIAEQIARLAETLGWKVTHAPDPGTATAVITGLSPLDSVIVIAHDDEIAGPILLAALGSRAGYIGALGGPRVQRSRADWLAARDITDLTRVYGPAGLDIGADAPPEVAIAVLAEALAVRSRRSARPLSGAEPANP